MKFVPNAISRRVATTALKTQKNSPTILFAAGVVGMVGTAVLASRATLKVEEVLNDIEKDQEDATRLHKQNRDDYTDADYNKDMAYIYVRYVVRIGKLYAPAIGLGIASIAALTGSHKILSKRNTTLALAYAGAERAFAEYRQRVIDEVGEDREQTIALGVQDRAVTDEVSGKVASVREATVAGASQYARFFDHTNHNWKRFPDLNRTFLNAQQQYATDKLVSNGHILLNEVYDMLGLERTPAGCVVGWVYGNGDNYVDFGMGDWPSAEDYINGRDQAVRLDFNVDGVVYELV